MSIDTKWHKNTSMVFRRFEYVLILKFTDAFCRFYNFFWRLPKILTIIEHK